jgi:hypothetical protein
MFDPLSSPEERSLVGFRSHSAVPFAVSMVRLAFADHSFS